MFACSGAGVKALDRSDIPGEELGDAVMPNQCEIDAMTEWASQAFTGTRSIRERSVVELKLRRQDHNVLRFGESILQTPLRIGQRSFKRGLGTHANSEIVVGVPSGARFFKAFVGLDNNDNTRAGRGSVEFIIEINGKAVFHSPTLRCGDDAAVVNVEIPKDIKELVLKVDATADGTGWDHADWAEARFIMADGSSLWLDERPALLPPLSLDPPFSFIHGGRASRDLLNTWVRKTESKNHSAFTEHHVRWTDTKTKLLVSADVKVYKNYPAVDWVLYFENQGERDSGILEDIQALDTSLVLKQDAIVLHGLRGDDCSERTFQPFARKLGTGQSFRMEPVGGRSSNESFPFFNLEYGGQGLLTAIGWSGQWAVSVTRNDTGDTRLRGGMEKTRLLLHPGERIRTPRILVMGWQGKRIAAHNRFRRLLMHHYIPQVEGKPLVMPTFLQGYDRYRTDPNWGTEAGQLHAANIAKALGCDFLWLDAAWFPGDFPKGVGNWMCKPKEFPNGLKPVSRACHNMGLKFIVWFEPERVATGSQIARERPEYVFGGEKGGLYNLNNPAARKWLTELLSQRITEFGMDWYRNDFNIDPLPFWRANDSEDRLGMTEIRYVEGHYAMWDELRLKHPGLIIDNCASGARRIDLETCMRSVSLWRSDTACRPGNSDLDQAHAFGLSLYLPLHQSCSWSPEAYVFRSAAGAGAITQFAFLDEGFSTGAAKEAIAEIRKNQKYWYGDFYPLTACTTAPDKFIAYQLHRTDLNAGIVLAFRRAECDVLGMGVKLGGLDPDVSYNVEFIDEDRSKSVRTITGRVMSTDFPLLIHKRRASLLVKYKADKI